MVAAARTAVRKTRAKPKAEPKPGRPTKYKPKYCELAIELGQQGKSYAAIANAIGVVRETLYDWMEQHPPFSDAMKRSRMAALEWWEATGQGQARGTIEGNATAMIFMMKNQFPDDYRDRREIKHDGELKIVEMDFTGFNDDDDTDD
ncbi:MAG: hypothetical protein ACRCVD_12110 [Halioglobus sp.]